MKKKMPIGFGATAISCIVEMGRDEAREYLKTQKMTMRVMQEDGKSLFGTADIKSNRVNVAVANNKVTAILSIGK